MKFTPLQTTAFARGILCFPTRDLSVGGVLFGLVWLLFAASIHAQPAAPPLDPQKERDIQLLLTNDLNVATLKEHLRTREITNLDYTKRLQEITAARNEILRRYDRNGQRELTALYNAAKRDRYQVEQDARRKAADEDRTKAAAAREQARQTSRALSPAAQATTTNARTEKPPDTKYLKEMPDPGRVFTEIQGTNQMDGAARQLGALRQLIKIVSLFSEGRDVMNKLTPEEEQVRRAYREAESRVAGANPFTYEFDETLRKEILERFFSATWRTNYLAFKARQDERFAGYERREQIRNDETKRTVARRRNEGYMGLAGAILGVVTFVCWGLMLVMPLTALRAQRKDSGKNANAKPPLIVSSSDAFRVNVWKQEYELEVASGLIYDKELWTETNVRTSTSGGGSYVAGGVVHSDPVHTHTNVTSTVYHRYWLRDSSGKETWVRFSEDKFPANKGHSISTIAKSGSIWIAYNHSTRHFAAFPHAWRKAHVYSIGWRSCILAAVTAPLSIFVDATLLSAVGMAGLMSGLWVFATVVWVFLTKISVANHRNSQFKSIYLPAIRKHLEESTPEVLTRFNSVPTSP